MMQVRTPYQLAVWGMIPERGPQTAKRELERERETRRGQTGPRDHGTKPAHRTGPPGHRFWIRGPQSYANQSSNNPQTPRCYGVLTIVISVDRCAADPESVARWPRLVCPRGPVVPWSRLAPWSRGPVAYTHHRGPATDGEVVGRGRVGGGVSSPSSRSSFDQGTRFGCPLDRLGVAGWSRGPVVPWSRLAPCLVPRLA